MTRSDVARRVKEMAGIVGLGNLLHRYPSELSGGQQQRVALARALVAQPRILLLDEPLSNLDADLRNQMRAELVQIHKKIGVTTIYVTHDQEEAMALSDLVILMSGGEIIETGTPRQIYDRPHTVYTASFIGRSNLLPARVVRDDPDRTVIEIAGRAQLTGQGAREFEAGEEVVAAIKPEDVEVHTGQPVANGLQAEVIRATYVGHHVGLLVKVLGEVFRIPQDKASTLALGDAMWISLPADRLTILPGPLRANELP